MPWIEVEVWAVDMEVYNAADGFLPKDAWTYYGTWSYESCSIVKPTDAIVKKLTDAGKTIRFVHTK